MKWKLIFGSLLIPLNVLLLFFLLSESRLVVPVWLQVIGRLHPMILHFPIVLVIGYALCEWFLSSRHLAGRMEVVDVLLLAAAFTAVLTAILGVLLAKEPAYEGAAIGWHKWLGGLTSFGLLGVYFLRPVLYARPLLNKVLAFSLLVVILVAGHLGGTISHGEDFVLGPLSVKEAKPVSPEEAVVYRDLVAPILESKCGQCHNSRVAKGGLAMDSRELLLKGGKEGKLWDTADGGMGLLMDRIHRPPEEKKHMPPITKPQLTNAEERILYSWIREGASFDKRLIELSPTDTLRILAAGILKTGGEEKYDFAEADEKKVQGLNTNYRVIAPLAKGSPALAVDFYGAAFFQSQQLKELTPLKEQIVSLNLDKMPVTDKDLVTISEFRNLRELLLSFTRITGAGLPALKGLTHLKSLSLSGTEIKAADIAILASLKSLHTLYIWNTGIPADALGSMQSARKDLAIVTGFRADTVHIKLNAPQLETEGRVIRRPDTPLILQLKHYVPGVTIRYTLNGSDPDSGGLVYNGPVALSSRAILSAKAYKKGWLASDVTGAYFFSEKYRPDSILLLKPVDSDYLKFKPGVLIDLDKGDLNYRNGKWLGFRKKGLECLLFFKQPVSVGDVTLSSLVDVNGLVMPPVSLEVWGGSEKGNLRLLGQLHPAQPDRSQPAYLFPYVIRFPAVNVRLLKIVARPVEKLPDWHFAKGKNAWIMADEIFVN